MLSEPELFKLVQPSIQIPFVEEVVVSSVKSQHEIPPKKILANFPEMSDWQGWQGGGGGGMYLKPPMLQLSTREMTAVPSRAVTTRIVIIVTCLTFGALKYPLFTGQDWTGPPLTLSTFFWSGPSTGIRISQGNLESGYRCKIINIHAKIFLSFIFYLSFLLYNIHTIYNKHIQYIYIPSLLSGQSAPAVYITGESHSR